MTSPTRADVLNCAAAAVPVPEAAPAPEIEIDVGPLLKGSGSLCFREPGREITVTGPVYARKIEGSWFLVPAPEMRRQMDAFVGGSPELAPEPEAGGRQEG
jgi:hypothetical protein